MRQCILSLLVLILCGFSTRVNATPIEALVLKDGSILEGHIVSQTIGKNVTFLSEIATIHLTGDCVLDVSNSKNESLENLSDGWKEWAKNHSDMLVKIDGITYVKMNDISLKKFLPNTEQKKDSVKTSKKQNILLGQVTTGNHVKVLESGAMFTYVDASNHTFNIDYSDIKEIRRFTRKPNVISGVIDVIEKKDGSVIEGQIVSQVIGECTKVLVDGSGIIETIKVSDIKAQKKKAYNEKLSLREQVQFLDKVETKSKSTIIGIITSQNISDKAEDCHYLLRISNNEVERIAFNDVVRINKEENPDYKEPLTDIIIDSSSDSIYLCRKAINKYDIVQDGDKSLYLKLCPDSVSFSLMASEINNTLVVECYNTLKNKDLVLLPAKLISFKKPKATYYGFSYKDLMDQRIKPRNMDDISPNNTLRFEYPISPGTYVIYRNTDRKCMIFDIK